VVEEVEGTSGAVGKSGAGDQRADGEGVNGTLVVETALGDSQGLLKIVRKKFSGSEAFQGEQ